ncbi:MAG: hypothetical protein HKL81_01370 [Acidimicrobiaceae bacterium]|nr:hypothetical protein [Acidimicrobiaceae bacterium]
MEDASGSKTLPTCERLQGALKNLSISRGSTVVVHALPATGSYTFLSLLLAEPSSKGIYSAVVGLDDYNFSLAAHLGVDLSKVITVDPKLKFSERELARAAFALLDGFGIVVISGRIASLNSPRFSAKARQKGATLVVIENSSSPKEISYRIKADLRLFVSRSPWTLSGSVSSGILAEGEIAVQAVERMEHHPGRRAS